MSIKTQALLKSLNVFHCATSPCNNCDIEILDALTPRHDLERFGITLVGSVRHADVLLVTGVPTRRNADILKNIYAQMPKPGLVIAVGTCALGLGMFKDGYNTVAPVDKIIPVDAYVPGCPPKPEAMIMGVVKLIKSLKAKTSA